MIEYIPIFQGAIKFQKTYKPRITDLLSYTLSLSRLLRQTIWMAALWGTGMFIFTILPNFPMLLETNQRPMDYIVFFSIYAPILVGASLLFGVLMSLFIAILAAFQPNCRMERKYSAYEEGLRIDTNKATTFVPWSTFLDVIRYRKSTCLRVSTNEFHVFPDRIFNASEEAVEFLIFLKDHVSRPE